MRIAIVGSGISGLVAAYRLCREHEVTVFEAGEHFGGHTYTVDVERHGRHWAVDMGFIVFNDWTYPRFIALLAELGVPWQDSNMSFSVSCERTGLEYNGTSMNALFAQRRNLVNPQFLGMLRDIVRFNRESRAVLRDVNDDRTLGEYLTTQRYSRAFRDYYIVPMGKAIWSATERGMLGFPVKLFVDFFARHGFLSIDDRPMWRAIRGGSREYARKLVAPFRSRIRLRTPVTGVARDAAGVSVRTARGDVERFDYVVFACHSDQALAMLEHPTRAEREILGAFPYQQNETVLHTDSRLLPRARLARAAWNYHALATLQDRVAVTYDMNVLQSLDAPGPFLVTLNRGADIDPDRVLHAATFHHPVYTPAAVAAQARRTEISGANRSFYCGAYWRYGFHEDGALSGEWVAEDVARVVGAVAGPTAIRAAG